MNDIAVSPRVKPVGAQPNLKGVFAAALTPVNADFTPDIKLHAAHCKWLLANGCDGLGVLGTTGEAASFSVAERIAIVEGLVKEGIPASKLLPGTGCAAFTDSVTLTKAALDVGAKGVLVLPPFYYKNVGDDGLADAYSAIIDRVNDPRLFLYFYHFPAMSAVPISHDLIARLRQRYGHTVAGMKDSSGVVENMVGAAKKNPGFEVFAGADPAFLPLLRDGGVGCITAACNLMPDVLAKIYANRDSAAAEAPHAIALKVREVVAKHGGIPAIRGLVARHTGNQQWLRPRPPLSAPAAANLKQLYADMDATGYKMPAL